MFVIDTMNNVRRLCSVRGDIRSRRWIVRAAVARDEYGMRYLLRNVDSGEYRTVSHRDMTSLY